MLRNGVGVLALALLAVLAGCGGDSSPGVSEETGGNVPGDAPGLVARAVSPSGLHADPLLVPEAPEVALTAFYGSPLTYLGYAPLELTPANSWLRVTGNIPVGYFPFYIAFAPDGSRAYVTMGGTEVKVIDVASGSVTGTLTAGNATRGVAFSPKGDVAYVANEDDDTVSVIDVASGSVTSTIPVGDGPRRVAFSPDGTQAYVTNVNADTVSVIDVAAGAVTATINVGDFPWGVAFTPDGSRAYVANLASDTVSVIAVATGTVASTIPVGDGPRDVDVTPNGMTAYVVNQYDDTVSVIDVATNSVTTTLNVGRTPQEVAFDPAGTTALVTNRGDDNVSVIDVATQVVTGTIPVGDAPTDVAFAPRSNLAYVGVQYDQRVTVIKRLGRRVFLGPNGQDQGFDPPFGMNKAGAIVANKTDRVVSCVLLDAKTQTTLAVEWTPGGAYYYGGSFLAIAAVTADQVTKVWTDQGPGQAPKKLVGGADAVFPQMTNSHVLLQFESGTGKLVNVMPTKARVTRGRGYEVLDNGDGTVTLRGDFVGVYAVASDRDVAPGGASAVTLDARTGEVLAVED